MKQKYLIYTLFGLLAANMSWNFVGQHEKGTSNLASVSSMVIDGKTIQVEISNNVETSDLIDAAGKPIEKRTKKVRIIDATEAGYCQCINGIETYVEVDSNNSLIGFVELLNELNKETQAKNEIERQKARAAREAAEKTAKEQREKEERCTLEDELDRLDCHQARLAEVADSLRTDCRRVNDRDREQARLCDKLESAYENHKAYITSYVDDLLDIIYTSKTSNDRELKREAQTAQRKLRSLQKSSNRVVKATVNALVTTEEEFASREGTYNQVQQLINMATQTNNPIFGMQAQQLQMYLKNQMQYINPQASLQSRLDSNYRGGLGEYTIDLFMSRNDALRKALGLDAIYPQNVSFANGQVQGQGQISNFRNFRGDGFSQNTGIPGATMASPSQVVNGPIVGQLDLSNLNSNGQSVIGTQPNVLVPNGQIGVRTIQRN